MSNKYKQWVEEEALENLKELVKILGRVPKNSDLKNYSFVPSTHYYQTHFGGLINACYIAGIIEKPLTDEERINISLIELIDLANQLGKCPTVYDFDNINHKGFKRRELERKLGMKYNLICKKYIPEKQVNIDRDITKDDIVLELIRINNVLGRPPMYKELVEFGCTYSYGLIQRIFNGMPYNQIIESLGWKPSYSTTLVKSKDELLNDFYHLFLKLKRIPYHNDLNESTITSAAPTYTKYFGSINNVCALLGIDYDSNYKYAGAGKLCLDMNGGLCRSLVEKDITNFFIINNIQYEKATSYSEVIKNDKRFFDWKVSVNKRIFYIEYAGMYYRYARGSIDKLYTKRMKKKIKDLYKRGIINECIFIYPNDIKNKTLTDLFSEYFDIPLLNYAYSHNTETIEYGCLSNNDILEKIMKYSKYNDILPSTRILSKQKSGLYKEILRRHGNYINFANIVNKQVLKKFPNYWSLEKIFEMFEYMIKKYSKILTPSQDKQIISNDYFCKNINTIVRKQKWIDIKIAFFEYCYNNDIIIPSFEIQWLTKVSNNEGTGIKNRVTIEQQEVAKKILQMYNF